MGLKDRSTLASERGGSWENAGVDRERSHVAYWPFSTHAAVCADVGFRATTEVLERHSDTYSVGPSGRALWV